ncbi:hypothetical protein CYMTET_11510 [Cymbomonas tetramitiformis]|uniref:Uncharacterized protein n=1 Tax=Cymbomonas tetramitiformis TaxID=36881 RepID=A0AAE0GMD8_9CHLO|nr:hypothetical protein CYMTET_11510 [Cymbomonas tetramitiformis]
MDDMIGGEELTDLARLHLIEGPQQGTLRVLRTRATPRAKAVYYLLVHKGPLSALVMQVEPTLRTEELRAQLARTFVNDLAAAAEADPPVSTGTRPTPVLTTTDRISSLSGEMGHGEEVSSALLRSRSPTHNGGAPPSPPCTRSPSSISARASSVAPSVSTGYTAAHGAREDEMLTDEMIDSDARDRREAITREAEEAMENLRRQHDASIREARYARHAASDVIHDGRYGAREQRLVDEAVASDTDILEVSLHQRPAEHRPVISLALPTASEDNFSDTTQVFQSSRQDQEAVSHESPQVRAPAEYHRPLREDVQAAGTKDQRGDHHGRPRTGASSRPERRNSPRSGQRRRRSPSPRERTKYAGVAAGGGTGQRTVRTFNEREAVERHEEMWRNKKEEVWWCRLFGRASGQLRPGAPNTKQWPRPRAGLAASHDLAGDASASALPPRGDACTHAVATTASLGSGDKLGSPGDREAPG